MIAIMIKTELVEWVQERLDIDADEAQNFAEEFAGMLYFSGGFPAEDGRLKKAAPLLLEALTEPLYRDGNFADELEDMASYLDDLDDTYLATAIRAKAQAIRGAIAAARGEAHTD